MSVAEAMPSQQSDGINIQHLLNTPGAMEGYAQESFYQFLMTWALQGQAGISDSQGDGSQVQPLFYKQQLDNMRLEDSTTMDIDWTHFMDYNGNIADIVASKFYRLESSLRAAVLGFVKKVAPEYAQDDNGIDKDFFISIYNMGSTDRLRDLRVEKVGNLCCFSGTVTRSSEVRPELYLASFRCLLCSTIVRGVEQQFKYTEPLICSNQTCNNKKQWALVREDSVFVDWQRVKVQESVDEVPAGSLPRTLDVIVRNKQVEEAKAGDKAVFTGTLVVVPDVGSLTLPSKVTVSSGAARNAGGGDGFTSKALGAREMTYRLMFIANSIQAADTKAGMVNIRPDFDQSPEEVLASYEPQHAQQVLSMSEDPQVYSKLTSSICPGIWGHEPIKQAVLLMLLGGVHKSTPEGMNLRGDINVAIVGDPACAKSQMLKYVAGFLPRAVYTSGKASTAAGLTASVVKEPENNEFAIEAGALMLADNGVCCIDEFDKMDVKDQVAIHEAMEQQTISITKAGIQATLNARASILAAANPVGGRYDKAKPLKYNVALPPALLSRFDLVHVMIDETTEEIDNRIAQHILRLHRYQGDAFANVHYTTDQLQRYIKYARAIKPELSQEAAERMVHAYKELRSEDAVPGSASAYRITVRQLEALVRLSEAVARAHCQSVVTTRHVDDAKRLLRSSILKIELQDVELQEEDQAQWDLGRAPINPEDMDQDMQPRQQGLQPEDADMADVGQENMQALANGAGPAAAAGPKEPKPAAAAAPAVQPKKTMKITAQKFTQMKGLLVQRVLDVQAEAQQAAAAIESGVAEEGVRQDALMTWYLNDQRTKGVLKTEEDLEAEMQLLFKVVNHLIRKDQVLAVLYRPEQQADESADAYAERVQIERVLTLHASFNPDE